VADTLRKRGVIGIETTRGDDEGGHASDVDVSQRGTMHPHAALLVLLLSTLANIAIINQMLINQAIGAHYCATYARTHEEGRKKCDKATLEHWKVYRDRQKDNRFKRLFGVTKEQFKALVERIVYLASSDAGTAGRSKGGRPEEVCTEIKLAMTLRYLRGGSYLDISDVFNVHDRTLYRAVDAMLLALNDRRVLPELSLPQDLKSPSRLAALAAGFAHRSCNVIHTCVGAIDGILLPIICPAQTHAKNQRQYWCRKQFWAINVQAIVDAQSRFIYASVRYPGAVHDSYAWKADPLSDELRGCTNLLSGGYHLNGDDAYCTHDTLATPWPGKSGAGARDAYNYHHSSCRIAVEQAFGMLTKRWLILKRPRSTTRRPSCRSCCSSA
jgi:hypothetical protein